MRIRTLLAGAIIGLGAISSVATAHQTTGVDPADATVFCGKPVGAGGVYVDNRSIAGDEYLYNVWIYVESNNHPGLQTIAGTESVAIGSLSVENCTTSGHSGVASDTMIF